VRAVVQEQVDGAAGDEVERFADGGQRDGKSAGDGDVVVADDGQVVGDAQAAGRGGGHDADGVVVVDGEDGGGRVVEIEQGVGGELAGLHRVRVAGDQAVVQGDAGLGQCVPVAVPAGHGGGGVFRSHDQPDRGVAVVDEFAGGQVAAEAVVADGGGVDAVGAQGQHLAGPGPGVVDVQRGAGAGGGADDAVDPAVQQGLHGQPLGVGPVPGGGHDREQPPGQGGGGDLLVEHGHHRVGQPGHDDSDGAGAGAA